MVFFSGGHIRPPALDGAASNNVATRLARHRQHTQHSRDRPALVVAPQLQQRTTLSSRNRSALLNEPGIAHGLGNASLPGASSWLQAPSATVELPFSTHPAGDSTPAAPDSVGSSGTHHFNGLPATSDGDHQPTSTTCCSHALPEELLRLADAAAAVSLPPPHTMPPGSLDNRELDKLVGTLGRNKATWRRALVLSQWLQESGHQLDDRLCTTLIRVCSEHGQAVTALSVYEWMKAPVAVGGAGLCPTVYTYTAAMRAALAAGLLERALQVWEDARAARCQVDCRLCITYIEVCSRKGITDRAMDMYAAMQSAPRGSKLAPTVHAYTAAMRAATEGGLWVRALGIWEDMKTAGVSPTGHAYAAAMSACAAGSNWQQAVTLFEDMCRAGIKPDVVSCTALISALAAAGQWQRAESVVQWMLTSGVRPNVRTYTALLTALGNARRWDRAFEMLELMQHSSWGAVTPNAYTYSALLKCLGECGEWQRAEQLFSALEQQALLQQGGTASSSHGVRTAAAASDAAAAAAAAAGSSAAAWQQSAAVTVAAAAAAAAAAAGGCEGLEGGVQAAAEADLWPLQGHGGVAAADMQGVVGSGSAPGLPGQPLHTHRVATAVSSSSSSSAASAVVSPASSGSMAAGGPGAAAVGLGPVQGPQDQQQQPTGGLSEQQEQEQQRQGLWTSASQLHGLDLDLQLGLPAVHSSSTSSSSDGSAAASRTSSPEPELLAGPQGACAAASIGGWPVAQQNDEAVAAAAAAAGVSSNMVAQQLAQLALQQQIAAGMDLQLLMHQQQVAARAASQQMQQRAALQQQHLQPPPPRAAPGGPVRTQQLQQLRQRQQQQQQQQQSGDPSRQGGAAGVINVYVVTSLMMAYERAGKWQACVGALGRGAALGVAPSPSMYSIAISAAGKAGQLAVAEALFAQARASGAADHATFETMVAVLGMAGDPARAEAMLRAMQAAGFKPGDYAYCGLIAGYSLVNDAAAAQRVRTRIVRENGPGSVGVHVYNALLAAADRSGTYDKALELLRCMRREGVEGDALTQQLASEVGRKGAVEVEGQQLTAAALSAAMAAAGTLLMRSGVW